MWVNQGHTIFFPILLHGLKANPKDASVAWASYTLFFPTQAEGLLTEVLNNSTLLLAHADSMTRVRHGQEV